MGIDRLCFSPVNIQANPTQPQNTQKNKVRNKTSKKNKGQTEKKDKEERNLKRNVSCNMRHFPKIIDCIRASEIALACLMR